MTRSQDSARVSTLRRAADGPRRAVCRVLITHSLRGGGASWWCGMDEHRCSAHATAFTALSRGPLARGRQLKVKTPPARPM